MSLSVQKGNAFSGQYVLDVIATATDWVGTVSLYRTYPGVAVFSVPITLSADGTKLVFTIPADQILNLEVGVYSLVGNINSAALAVDTYRVDYITVTSLEVSTSTKCKLFGTIEKSDGTPTGTATTTLTNSAGGMVLTSGWKGVDVKATNSVADVDSGKIVSIETVTTQTNAAGYFELYPIQGLTVTVTCPSFGKSVTVDTTGLTTIDLSTFF